MTTIDGLANALHWEWLPALSRAVLEQAITIQQIPSPTFAEATRAAYVEGLFRQRGLADVTMDEMHNVYGRLAGQNPQAAPVLVSAHTDTVFAQETDLTIRRDGERVYGPGLGDNSIAVASLIGLLDALREVKRTPACDVWFIANTREEGLGDLGGMKAVMARLGGAAKAVLNLEGLAFGRVYHAGIAVRRWKITARAAGGHSWLDFGQPSAIHGLIGLAGRIMALKPPTTPRTTYNIGVIEGGQSVNTIAAEARLLLDMRSEESKTLAAFEAQVREQVNAAAQPGLTFSVQVVGDRPAGRIALEHPLVRCALDVLGHLGVHATLENSSTDANIPLSTGLPAVTVGITSGDNAHRLDEYIDTPFIASGLKQLLLLTLLVAERSF